MRRSASPGLCVCISCIVIELMIAVLHIDSNENDRPATQHNSPKRARHAKRGSKCSQLEYKTTNHDAFDFFFPFGADQLTWDMRNMTMVAGHSQDLFFSGDGNNKTNEANSKSYRI